MAMAQWNALLFSLLTHGGAMAGQINKRKKIYYRKAEFSSRQDRTLQQMVAEALVNNLLVDERLEPIGAQAAHFRVTGSYREEGPFLFGALLTYERGSYQPVVSEHPGAQVCAIDALMPPLIDDVQYQYLPGVLYFVLFENHVVAIQYTTARVSGLEQHLAWLLRKDKILSNKEGFILKDEPRPATKERIRKSHVKSISLGRHFMDEHVQLQGSGSIQQNKITRYRPEPGVVNILRNLFADSSRFEKLDLENSVFDSNLEVWIEIRFPKGQRQSSQSEASIKLLDTLGIALRDIDEDQSKLVLGDGSVIRGDELKVFSDIEFSVSAKGIPDESELFASMRSWLLNQIKNGAVAPD